MQESAKLEEGWSDPCKRLPIEEVRTTRTTTEPPPNIGREPRIIEYITYRTPRSAASAASARSALASAASHARRSTAASRRSSAALFTCPGVPCSPSTPPPDY